MSEGRPRDRFDHSLPRVRGVVLRKPFGLIVDPFRVRLPAEVWRKQLRLLAEDGLRAIRTAFAAAVRWIRETAKAAGWGLLGQERSGYRVANLAGYWTPAAISAVALTTSLLR